MAWRSWPPPRAGMASRWRWFPATPWRTSGSTALDPAGRAAQANLGLFPRRRARQHRGLPGFHRHQNFRGGRVARAATCADLRLFRSRLPACAQGRGNSVHPVLSQRLSRGRHGAGDRACLSAGAREFRVLAFYVSSLKDASACAPLVERSRRKSPTSSSTPPLFPRGSTAAAACSTRPTRPCCR